MRKSLGLIVILAAGARAQTTATRGGPQAPAPLGAIAGPAAGYGTVAPLPLSWTIGVLTPPALPAALIPEAAPSPTAQSVLVQIAEGIDSSPKENPADAAAALNQYYSGAARVSASDSQSSAPIAPDFASAREKVQEIFAANTGRLAKAIRLFRPKYDRYSNDELFQQTNCAFTSKALGHYLREAGLAAYLVVGVGHVYLGMQVRVGDAVEEMVIDPTYRQHYTGPSDEKTDFGAMPKILAERRGLLKSALSSFPLKPSWERQAGGMRFEDWYAPAYRSATDIIEFSRMARFSAEMRRSNELSALVAELPGPASPSLRAYVHIDQDGKLWTLTGEGLSSNPAFLDFSGVRERDVAGEALIETSGEGRYRVAGLLPMQGVRTFYLALQQLSARYARVRLGHDSANFSSPHLIGTALQAFLTQHRDELPAPEEGLSLEITWSARASESGKRFLNLADFVKAEAIEAPAAKPLALAKPGLGQALARRSSMAVAAGLFLTQAAAPAFAMKDPGHRYVTPEGSVTWIIFWSLVLLLCVGILVVDELRKSSWNRKEKL